jgi:hypothetical protein
MTATKNGAPVKPVTKNGDRVAALEEGQRIAAWLIAEQQHRNNTLAIAVAQLMAQRIQPAVQQQILSKLLGG